ncbi:sulfite reductase subunit alpha [Pseudomonas sp. HMWF032]|uniref:sulfite reductase subunit alpha n=1 Tax=Pseudomonas sp. HMWF032 TaxID=2056866 RepID=UPI0021153E1B|nr:sulfite reductase subunit alpha [Pseudomonas sp. HMWF032]
MITAPRLHALCHWPLPTCLLLAGLLFWLQPARELSAGLISATYLALCLHYCWPQRRIPSGQTGELLIAYASQGGQALALAERSCAQLRDSGMPARCIALNQLGDAQLASLERLLLVVSTYGDGEAPDNAARFECSLLEQASLPQLHFAILALGDSSYPQFCAFGQRLQLRLQALKAQPLFDLLCVDNLDAGTLRHWQQQLGHLSGNSDFVDWQPAHYRPWQLEQRLCLNPGSIGAPIFQLRLSSQEDVTWRAGDIVEVGPRHAPQRINACLQQLGLDPQQHLPDGQLLRDALSQRHLPTTRPDQQSMAQWLAELTPLPHREYSIASCRSSGNLDLLVRLQHQADGSPGLGSGWLCQHAEIGRQIDLRIRRNPGFQGPDATTPLILIGSGSGLAGLRAHLQERAANPHSRNWLLFGERQAAHDALLIDELRAWQHSGHLERLDLTYSRDGHPQRYVQDALCDAASTLHAWLADGAALYLCGSLDGMGRDVDTCLRQLLGDEQVDQLSQSGRYRRDLY